MTGSIEAAASSFHGDKQITHQENAPPYTYDEKSKVWDDKALKDLVVTTDPDQALTIWQAFRLHKKAVGWSLIVSAAVIMEGYDTALLGALYGFPAFQKQYGDPYEGGGYQISAAWQTALSMGTNIGVVIGVFANGILTFFSTTAPVLFVGEVLCGIPWGVFSTLAPAYASEVCPVALRGYLTTYVNLCWVTGQLVASGVLESLQGRDDQWAYKLPFAIQWAWPIPLFCAICFAPESPWWLVRRDRIGDAKGALARLLQGLFQRIQPSKN